METSKESDTPKVYWLLAITTCGTLLFAGLYFTSPKPTSGNIQNVTQIVTNTEVNTVTNTVMTTVTNEVVKEVPKEVQKIVQVPADIPQNYIYGDIFLKSVRNAPITKSTGQNLFAMDDVKVMYILDDTIRRTLLEDDVKAKFELTLRNNGVPVSADSKNTITLSLTGFYDRTATLLCYALNVHLYESEIIIRNGELRKGVVGVWSTDGVHGIVGKEIATDPLLKTIVNSAEVFANAYLSANPKGSKIERDLNFANLELLCWETQLSNVKAEKDWTPFRGWDAYGLPVYGNALPASNDAAEQIRERISEATQIRDRLKKQTQ